MRQHHATTLLYLPLLPLALILGRILVVSGFGKERKRGRVLSEYCDDDYDDDEGSDNRKKKKDREDENMENFGKNGE